MPTYTFRKGKKEWSEFMTISEMEQYLKDNPDIEMGVSGAPMIGYHTLRQKPDSWFRDKMKAIKKHHPGNTIGKVTRDWG